MGKTESTTAASDLELRALARSWQVNIVVVPADSRLEPEAFTTQKAKKTLAFWLENKHIDLLLPVEGNKYPEELFSCSLGSFLWFSCRWQVCCLRLLQT